jgi:hypothetical protein
MQVGFKMMTHRERGRRQDILFDFGRAHKGWGGGRIKGGRSGVLESPTFYGSVANSASITSLIFSGRGSLSSDTVWILSVKCLEWKERWSTYEFCADEQSVPSLSRHWNQSWKQQPSTSEQEDTFPYAQRLQSRLVET